MLFRSLLLATILATSALAADNGARRCIPRFHNPSFPTVDRFTEVLQAQERPWSELLEPDKIPEYDASDEIVASWALQVQAVHHSARQAIVFAQYKANRTAPFSALIFLLTKEGRRWHVSDFIRRSVGYGSYSVVKPPTILKLRPSRHLHFYFQNELGGRKLAVETDEFYMVEGSHLRRTLLVKNVGAFISPAEPWREFTQSAEVSAVSGRPRIGIQRTWGLENGEERKQSFAVTFRWDLRGRKFVSPNAGKLSVNEPIAWTSKGLPAPPSGE